MRLKLFLITFIFLIFIISFTSFACSLRINEVEQNPPGTDAGHEWVELYSDTWINLFGYYLKNYNGAKIVNLSGNFSGYFVYNFSSQWLRNENETVYLGNYTNWVIDQTPALDDTKDDSFSWNYCNGTWLFLNSTKGFQNDCSQSGAQTNSSSNSSTGSSPKINSSQQNSTSNSTKEITYEPIDYDYYNIHSKTNNQNTTLNTISLNSQTIKTGKISAIGSKIKSYAVYYIITFAVLLLLLFLLKKRKKDKNEFDQST